MKQLFGISFTSLNHTFAWLTFKLCSDSRCFFFWNNCFNKWGRGDFIPASPYNEDQAMPLSYTRLLALEAFMM